MSTVWDDKRRAEVQRMIDELMTTAEIAAVYGLTEAGMERRLQRLGIKRTPEQRRAVRAKGARLTGELRRAGMTSRPLPATDLDDEDDASFSDRSFREFVGVEWCARRHGRYLVGDRPDAIGPGITAARVFVQS